jgi:hypothetical protein
VGRSLRPRSLNWRDALPPAHFLLDANLADTALLAALLNRISKSEVGDGPPAVNVAALLRENADFSAQVIQFGRRFRRLHLRKMLDHICAPSSQKDALVNAVHKRRVVRFLRAVLNRTGLLKIVGTARNQRWLMKCVRFYVCRPRQSSCPLGQLMAGFHLPDIEWLSALPCRLAAHILAKLLGEFGN